MTIESYPNPNGVLTSLIWRKTATGGETSLSGYDDSSQALSYTPGQEQVYLNGILLVRGSDYTATTGTSITGLSALAASDYVQINCYNNFSVASVPTTSLTGTVTNAQLANSSVTIGSTSVSLGSTAATITGLTLTSPVIATISNTGTITLPTSTDTLVGRATTDTLTNKTLTAPVISTISNTGTLTLPTSTDTLVGRATTDTLTNKTLTAPVVTMSVNTQTGTSYTPVLTDAAAIVTLNNASAISLTIPTNASVAYAIGTQLNFIQIGAGQVTITAATPATTTIASTGATATGPKLRVQYSSATAIKVATDTWYVVGDIA